MADTTNDAVLTLAKARFDLVLEAEAEQRRREEDDLKFDAGDQWPDDVKAARGGQVVDGVPIPARPMLINLRDAAPNGSFERVLEVVPADPAARGPLRERWKHYQALGFEVNKHDM